MMTVLSACQHKTADKQTQAPVDTVAADDTDAVISESETPTIVVGSAEAHPGDTVVLPIYVMHSPGIAACRLVVEYDNENLVLESVAYGSAFAENGEEPVHLKSPFILAWSQLDNLVGNELFAELTFKVDDEAKTLRSFPVTITCAPADLINIDEIEVEFTIENGSISTVK